MSWKGERLRERKSFEVSTYDNHNPLSISFSIPTSGILYYSPIHIFSSYFFFFKCLSSISSSTTSPILVVVTLRAPLLILFSRLSILPPKWGFHVPQKSSYFLPLSLSLTFFLACAMIYSQYSLETWQRRRKRRERRLNLLTSWREDHEKGKVRGSLTRFLPLHHLNSSLHLIFFIHWQPYNLRAFLSILFF